MDDHVQLRSGPSRWCPDVQAETIHFGCASLFARRSVLIGRADLRTRFDRPRLAAPQFPHRRCRGWSSQISFGATRQQLAAAQPTANLQSIAGHARAGGLRQCWGTEEDNRLFTLQSVGSRRAQGSGLPNHRMLAPNLCAPRGPAMRWA